MLRPLDPQRCRVVPGRYYRTPKEVWGFLTESHGGAPVAVASAFLGANARFLGIQGVRSTLRFVRLINSLGAIHVLFQQSHLGLRIHRGYVTVHLDRRNRVYLVKNRAAPRDRLPAQAVYRITETTARRRALLSLPAPQRAVRVLESHQMWFPLRGSVRPAFRVRLMRQRPAEEWIVYVNGVTGRIFSQYDNLAQREGRAHVFDPNPVIAIGDWRRFIRLGLRVGPPADAYRAVRLRDLQGTGFLDGPRVSTRLTRGRVRRQDHRFLFRSGEPPFTEVMVYYHLERAIRYVESLGYRGGTAIFQEPLLADATATRGDFSWYSPGLRQLSFGQGEIRDAEDADIILHEFGHAIQDAICPDFGQTPQAAAIGEGFSDYFAASFFAAKKPPGFRPALASWNGIRDQEYDPPCMRRVDEPLTFEVFDHGPECDEHDNGKIWASTLWAIRREVGRRIADRLAIEGHFQLDDFATFAQAARAILDADRNLHHGRYARTLRKVFHARGIGPVDS